MNVLISMNHISMSIGYREKNHNKFVDVLVFDVFHPQFTLRDENFNVQF